MPVIFRSKKLSHDAFPRLQFRPRILTGSEIALGPGKAELLTAIQSLGSISRAAKSLGMSYMRAWTLIQTMNKSFRAPLVEVSRGGVQGGTARLSTLGEEVLGLYQEMIQQSQKATRPIWKKLQRRLKVDS